MPRVPRSLGDRRAFGKCPGKGGAGNFASTQSSQSPFAAGATIFWRVLEFRDRRFSAELQDLGVGVGHDLLGLEVAGDRDLFVILASEGDGRPRLAVVLGNRAVAFLLEAFPGACGEFDRHPAGSQILDLRLDDPVFAVLGQLRVGDLIFRNDHLEEPLLREFIKRLGILGVLAEHGQEVLKNGMVGVVAIFLEELLDAVEHPVATHLLHEHPEHPASFVVGDGLVAVAAPIRFHKRPFRV